MYDKYSTKAKFIVTGSSSLKIKEIASFLVGRAIFFNLYPFSFAEFLSYKDEKIYRLWKQKNHLLQAFLKNKIKTVAKQNWIFENEMERYFDEYITYGGYPAIATSRKKFKEERLRALVDTYIEKDIIGYLQVGNFLDFKRLVRILALQVGNLVNFSSLQTDTRSSYREIKRFIGFMENTFILKLLNPYYVNKISEIKKSPKVYFLDLGLRNSLVSDFRSINLRPDKGGLVENFIFNNLHYQKAVNNLRFWRTKQGAEVDFVLKNKTTGAITAIEVKYQPLVKPTLTHSLTSFLKKYHPEKIVVFNKNLFETKKYGQTTVLFIPIFFV